VKPSHKVPAPGAGFTLLGPSAAAAGFVYRHTSGFTATTSVDEDHDLPAMFHVSVCSSDGRPNDAEIALTRAAFGMGSAEEYNPPQAKITRHLWLPVGGRS
jgi:hypothetical protein